MKNFVSFSNFVNESQKDTHGNTPVNILIGRFDPFHIGHYSAAKELVDKNGYPVVIVSVRGKGDFGKGTTVSKELFDKMVSKLVKTVPFINGHIEITNVSFDKQLFVNLRPKYEPVLLGAGADRIKGYTAQMNSFRDKKGNVINMRQDFDVVQTSRKASGTEVREIISKKDKKNFLRLMPKELHNFWDELVKELNETKRPLSYHIDIYDKAIQKLVESKKKDNKTISTIERLIVEKTKLIQNYSDLIK